jgi:hypothetical protein
VRRLGCCSILTLDNSVGEIVLEFASGPVKLRCDLGLMVWASSLLDVVHEEEENETVGGVMSCARATWCGYTVEVWRIAWPASNPPHFPKVFNPLSTHSSHSTMASSPRLLTTLTQRATGKHSATVIFMHGLGDTGAGWQVSTVR